MRCHTPTAWLLVELLLCFNLVVCVRFVGGNACKSCHLRQQEDDRLKGIRGQILTKLGRTEPPFETTATIQDGDDAMETYREAARESRKRDTIHQACSGFPVRSHSSYFARTIAKLPLIEEIGKAVLLYDQTKKKTMHADIFVLKFNTSEIDHEADVERAELRINEGWVSTGSEAKMYICEHDKDATIPSHYNATLEEICRNMIGSRDIDVRIKSAVTFDATRLVQTWAEEPRANTGITIVIMTSLGDEKRPETSPDEHKATVPTPDKSKVPRSSPHILTWYIPVKRSTEEKRRRQKRALNMRFCKKRLKEKRCCLRSLYVDFQRDLKWKWIHAPPGFHANYCGGECPFLWGYHNQTHHTTVMGLLNSYNPDSPGKPCCVANAYKPLVILYYEQGRPRIEELTNMIVSECNCV